MESEIGPDDEGEPSPATEPGSENTAFAPVEPAPMTPPAAPAQDAPPGPAGQQPMAPRQPAQPGQQGGPFPPGAPMPPLQPPGPGLAGPGHPGQPGGPYGYQPYGYPAYGYGTPPPPAGTNGMAIASLVLGILGFFFITPIIGLVLGLVALASVKRSGQKGKGQAISGIVLSSLWIALFATLIVVAVVIAPDPAKRDADGNVVRKGAVGIFDLHAKDCFTVPAGLIGSTDSKTRNLTVVPCSTPHDSEAFGSFDGTEDSYPGLDAMRAEAVTQCVKILDTYLPDPLGLPTGSRIQFLVGNRQTWDRGIHKVECFVQFPDATATASIQRDKSSYTADQLRFLQAMQPLSDAVTQLNATTDSTSLDVLRQRARDVANGMQTEITALTASPWPADVQPTVDALVAQHRNAAQLWSEAAGAGDVTAFGDAVRRAGGALDMTDIQAARRALGFAKAGSGNANPSASLSQTT